MLDVTGSMRTLYKNGTVQEVVERILAVASKFDDNAALDVWVYDHEFSRLPTVTERDFIERVFTVLELSMTTKMVRPALKIVNPLAI